MLSKKVIQVMLSIEKSPLKNIAIRSVSPFKNMFSIYTIMLMTVSMLKRKIENKLIQWKNDTSHKPLIIKGCRQCGKTWSVLDFAKKNYKNVIYMNFFENPDFKSIFSPSLEIDYLTMMISAMMGSSAVFEPKNPVLNHPEKYHVYQAIKLGNYNVGRESMILTIPHYMVFLLTEY